MKFFSELSIIIIAVGATFMNLLEEPTASIQYNEKSLEIFLPLVDQDLALAFPTFFTPFLTVLPLFLFSLWVRKKDDWRDVLKKFLVYAISVFFLFLVFSFVVDAIGLSENLPTAIFALFFVIVSAVVRGSLVIRDLDRWFVDSLVELLGICLASSLIMSIIIAIQKNFQPDFLRTWFGVNLDLCLLAGIYFLPWAGLAKLTQFFKDK